MRKVPTNTKRLRRVVGGCLALTALLYVLFPIWYPLPFRVPLRVAQRAGRQVGNVRPGMNEQEVWRTLGLTGYNVKSRIVSRSGQPNRMPENYILWPGYMLHTEWNYRTHPKTLVKAAFLDH